MKRLLTAVAIFGLTGVGSVHAQTIAYEDPSNQGGQAWGGNLGLLFHVNSPIVVTALGVFNASGSGTISGTIQVVIYNTTTNTAVTPVVTFHTTHPLGLVSMFSSRSPQSSLGLVRTRSMQSGSAVAISTGT